MKLPAGKWWIGDLCYALGNRWDEFCELTISGHSCLEGTFKFKDGTTFATFGTRWGDGTYLDQFGNEYPVDAGLIGCVKVSETDTGADLTLGHIQEFDTDFEVGSEASGVIYFGHILIDTDPDPEEEEEDDYYEDDQEY